MNMLAWSKVVCTSQKFDFDAVMFPQTLVMDGAVQHLFLPLTLCNERRTMRESLSHYLFLVRLICDQEKGSASQDLNLRESCKGLMLTHW